jgi:hypothetical protein
MNKSSEALQVAKIVENALITSDYHLGTLLSIILANRIMQDLHRAKIGFYVDQNIPDVPQRRRVDKLVQQPKKELP